MKWLAEQKILVEVEAETEEEAREIIASNVMQCNSENAKVIRQGQQSWVVPLDDYWKSRFGLNAPAK